MKKTTIMMVCLLTALFFGGATTSVFAQETMTNAEVMTLVKAGLNKAIIINKIQTSKHNFDLSTDALIKLKQANVPDEIVAAMLQAKSGVPVAQSSGSNGTAMAAGDPNDPASPHDYGIYHFQDRDGGKKMTQMTVNVSAQNRTGGGFTASMTPFGLGKVKTKANLPGRNASMQLKETRPVFYFYLDTKSGGFNTVSGIPSTPNEIVLVRFNIRSDNREITIAKANAWGAKGGLSDEYVVGFDSESMGNGVYKVTPKTDLKNGEYAFYLVNSGNSNASAAVGAKFFDFGVQLVP